MTAARILGSVLVLLFVLAPGIRAQSERLNVPERKAIAAERRAYKKRIKAESDPAKMVAVLLTRGLEEGAHPPLRYALLEDAAALALKAETFDMGLRASRELANYFAVDRAKVVREFIIDFSKSRRSPRWAARAAGALIETAGRALADGETKSARKLIRDAEAQAKKFKLAGIARRAKQLETLIGDFAKTEKRVAKGGDAALPLDLAVLLLVRGGDMVTAALELERSADEGLKALGAASGTRPTKAAAMLDLAKLWWQEAAELKSAVAKAAFRARGLDLALRCVGRVNSDLQERLAPWLVRPQYRAFGGRVLVMGEDKSGAADDYALIQIDDFIARQAIDHQRKDWRLRLPKFPELTFTPKRRYLAQMVTSEGELILELVPEAAPRHVANFIYLSRLGFYDDLEVHRIVQSFMAQFGCPLGTGSGGPGYKFDGELETSLKHDRTGMLSMAHSGPGTDGSQFFVTFTATPHLDGKHTAFGRMITGRKTCAALERLGAQDEKGQPKKPVTLEAIRIFCF